MPSKTQVLYFFTFILIAFNIYRAYEKNWHGGDPIDFRGLYVQTLLFFEDQPTYDDSVASKKWDELKSNEGFSSNTDLGDQYYSIMLYPPQSPIILSWLKFFSWKNIRWVWWGICLISFIYILFYLYQVSNSVLIILLALGSKAAFSALSLGQPLLPVLALILLAFQLVKDRPYTSGILLGLALLKFTVVIPFALLLLIKGKIKPLITLGLTGIALLIPAILQDHSIISQFLAKVNDYYDLIYVPHPLNIYTYSSSDITMLIDYYYSAPAKVWTTLGLTLQLISAGVFALLYRKKRISEIALFSLLILTSFLFSYHLTYDALMLLVPIAFYLKDKTSLLYPSLWFIVLSLPINAAVGNGNLLSFNYPILILLAIIFIIFAWRKKHPEYRIAHIVD